MLCATHQHRTQNPATMDNPATVGVLGKEPLNYNVSSFRVERPKDFDFEPGQACRIAVDRDGWRDEFRPMTMCSLPDEDHLEFVIKHYRDHDGVTKMMQSVQCGEQFRLQPPGGYITYQGPGVFIAGGAGLTPFLAILRDLARKGKLDGHRLWFSNSRTQDLFLKKELDSLLQWKATYLLTDEEGDDPDPNDNIPYRRIDADFVNEQFRTDPELADGKAEDQWFYLCGPPSFSEEISEHLANAGADPEKIVHKGWKS